MIAEYINTHHAEFWIAIGFLLLVLEVITGLTVGVFLFAGLGALITGLLMLASILPETWTAGIASIGICSGIITALLLKPLRQLQGNRAPGKDNSSDFIGLEFPIEQDIKTQQPGVKRYSGIDWRVEIDKSAGVDEMTAGQHVVVTSIDVGVFRVKPVD